MHSETNITFVTLNLVGNNGAICNRFSGRFILFIPVVYPCMYGIMNYLYEFYLNLIVCLSLFVDLRGLQFTTSITTKFFSCTLVISNLNHKDTPQPFFVCKDLFVFYNPVCK